MANGMMNSPMGAQQPPMEQPGMQMGAGEDAVLDISTAAGTYLNTPNRNTSVK